MKSGMRSIGDDDVRDRARDEQLVDRGDAPIGSAVRRAGARRRAAAGCSTSPSAWRRCAARRRRRALRAARGARAGARAAGLSLRRVGSRAHPLLEVGPSVALAPEAPVPAAPDGGGRCGASRTSRAARRRRRARRGGGRRVHHARRGGHQSLATDLPAAATPFSTPIALFMRLIVSAIVDAATRPARSLSSTVSAKR